jgi:signal transduction histidine kinase
VFQLAKSSWSRSAFRGLFFGSVFFLLTAAYILLGDRMVEWLARDVAEASRMQTFKGLAFMAISALTIALVVGVSHYRQRRRHLRMLEADRRSMAGVMSSSVAHDINNMLTSALLEAEMIQGGMSGDSSAGNLKKSLLEISRLTRNLRDFGKDQLSVQLDPLDLSIVVGEAMAICHKHPCLRSASVEEELQPGLIAPCQATQIQQMVLNLLLNSAEASEQPRIRVRLFRSQGKAELRVEDNGPGVPDNARETIFEPFYTTKEKGTGLGLASVKAAVAVHNGTINYQKSEWGGACFIIRLPLVD